MRGRRAIALFVAFVAAGSAGCEGEAAPRSPTPPAASEPAGAIVVESSDGLVTMRLAASALPDGVSAEDLAIEPVEVADDAGPGEPPFLIHRFVPEGVRLSEPASVEVLVTGGQLSNGLMAFHVSGEEAEPLEVELAEATDGSYTAAFEVEHFSWFSFHSNTYFDVQVEEPSRRAFTIGEVVPSKVRIFWVDHGRNEATFIVPEPGGGSRFEWRGTGPAKETFQIDGGATDTATRGILGPTVQLLPVAMTTATREWTGSTSFVCAQEGSEVLRYLAAVRFQITFGAALADPVDVDVWGWATGTSKGFRCGRFINLHLGAGLHHPGRFPLEVGHRTDSCPGFATEYAQDLKLSVGRELPSSEGIAARQAVLSDADGSHPVKGVVSYDEGRQAWVFRGKGEDGTSYDVDLTGGTGRLGFTTPDGRTCTYTMTFDPGVFLEPGSGD